ncbi:hypothetical protein RHCRD62_30195 [Rhodococcus sp. RD6.2]|nr:hypothetical protein RHCRD62_30195 [Rhodococcus sp. RD6.2]
MDATRLADTPWHSSNTWVAHLGNLGWFVLCVNDTTTLLVRSDKQQTEWNPGGNRSNELAGLDSVSLSRHVVPAFRRT